MFDYLDQRSRLDSDFRKRKTDRVFYCEKCGEEVDDENIDYMDRHKRCLTTVIDITNLNL